MKLNKKVLAVTAILAVGVLAGCGSSDDSIFRNRFWGNSRSGVKDSGC